MYTHRAYHVRYTIRECHARVLVLGVVLKTGLAWVWCRCIQRADQPIILTGFSALNKLLGREVYSSQMQLGGPKVIKTSQIFVHCKQIIVHITVFLILTFITIISIHPVSLARCPVPLYCLFDLMTPTQLGAELLAHPIKLLRSFCPMLTGL